MLRMASSQNMIDGSPKYYYTHELIMYASDKQAIEMFRPNSTMQFNPQHKRGPDVPVVYLGSLNIKGTVVLKLLAKGVICYGSASGLVGYMEPALNA